MLKCILKAVWILTVVFSIGIDSHFCKYHVCLTWTVSDQVLNLKCRVSNLHFRVKIQDPSDKLIGECVPSQKKSNCDRYANNVVIAQNIKTNETTCMIRGIIDKSLNGKWKCLHGTNQGLADVEVTVLRNKEKNEDQNCKAMFWSMVCYFGIITLWLTFLSIYPGNINIVEGILTKISDHTWCKCNVSKLKRSISVCKGASFFVMTVLFVIIVWAVSISRDTTCKDQYYVLCSLAPPFGLITAVLCLKMKVKTGVQPEPTENITPDSEETFTCAEVGRNIDEDPNGERVPRSSEGYLPLPTDEMAAAESTTSKVKEDEMAAAESTTSKEREESSE